MRKDHKNTINEYVGNISDDELRLLQSRLLEKMNDDMPEALNLMSKHNGMDHVLSFAKSVDDFFDLCDFVGEASARESKRRSISQMST